MRRPGNPLRGLMLGQNQLCGVNWKGRGKYTSAAVEVRWRSLALICTLALALARTLALAPTLALSLAPTLVPTLTLTLRLTRT